jgi:hypothetical protein
LTDIGATGHAGFELILIIPRMSEKADPFAIQWIKIFLFDQKQGFLKSHSSQFRENGFAQN